MNTKLQELIINGLYPEAEKNLQKIEVNLQMGTLLKIGFDTENINVYTFTIFMLSKNETGDLHVLASRLLALPFCHIEGAYQSSVMHLKRAIELEPENIDYLIFLLFFYEIPDQVISKDEAKEVAQRILNYDPSNQIAQKILKS